jgi:ribonucleoside-diphosphate reductase alpha subunit
MTDATKFIVKSSSGVELADKQKIFQRIQRQCKKNLLTHINPTKLCLTVWESLGKQTPSKEIDVLISETAANMSNQHPEYAKLAAYICISMLHKATPDKFSSYFDALHLFRNDIYRDTMFDPRFVTFVEKYKNEIDAEIQHDRDFEMYDYFGFKTLERSYLLKLKGKIIERPQYLLMRVALALQMEAQDLKAAFQTYHYFYQKLYTHATPTLFNSGLKHGNYSSCYLLTMAGDGDSIESIYDTLKNCALISKSAGGIGLSVHTIRASGSSIRGTNGTSNGLIPMLRVYNNTARYVDQCFAEGTMVYCKSQDQKTEEMILKSIEMVTEGDQVLTHTGKFQKVEKQLKYSSDESKVLYEIEIECPYFKKEGAVTVGQYKDKIVKQYVTNQHPLYAVEKSKVLESTNRSEFEFLEVEKLTIEHYVTFPLAIILSSRYVQTNRLVVRGDSDGNQFILAPVRGIRKVNHNVTPNLYDLEVEQDHSYVTDIGTCHNGGGKRKGSFAIYLEPWHADIFAFLQLKKNQGADEMRARDLFYGLWVPDLFMKRVEENGKWSLFCPDEARGLCDVHSEQFVELYERYEKEGKAKKTVKARDLWHAILEAQSETGTPYIVYKDACNRKSNQQNLGTIRSSNLCVEIVEYTSKDEIAVCNLASISLPMFVPARESKESKEQSPFDHQKLFEVIQLIVLNLNRIIDINHYPVPEAKRSNLRHRPIGIGVQGLAEVFMMNRMPYESEAAQQLNIEIFETIYFAAVSASVELAKVEGPYETFKGSPMSQGKFQFDLWEPNQRPKFSGRWDWESLRRKVVKHGVRNSLLVAPMPTATTSQILGNTESFEPLLSNLFLRRTLAGEFHCVNSFLVNDLIELKLWNRKMREKIIAERGSIQNIPEIPDSVKKLYKTVWEMKMKTLIDMAAARGVYIDQSQSFNMYSKNDMTKLTQMHFYGWKKGLKSGCYYLRTLPSTDAIAFTIDPLVAQAKTQVSNTSSSSLLTVTVDNTVTAFVAAASVPEGSVPQPFVCKREPGCDSCGS